MTVATNSQTPVDLRANDSRQQELTLAIKQLGYDYIAKRELFGKFYDDFDLSLL